MTDYASQYSVGENIDGNFNGGSLTMSVKYTEDIAAGEALDIDISADLNVDNLPVKKTSSATANTRFIAIHNGVAGDIKEALLQGRVKVELGGTATAGEHASTSSSGLFLNTSATRNTVGFFLHSGVINDFIILYFSGINVEV